MRVPFPDKCFNEDTMVSPYSFILKPRKGPQSNEPFIYKTCEVFYFFFFYVSFWRVLINLFQMFPQESGKR